MDRYSKRDLLVFIVTLVLLLLSGISIVLLILRDNPTYKTLILLPATFMFMYFATIYRLLRNENCCYVSITVALTYGIRCVIYPFFLSLCHQDYTGARYLQVSNSDLVWSVVLISIETTLALFFVYIWDHRFSKNNDADTQIEMKGSKTVYCFVILIAVALYLLVGRKYQVINFIKFSDETGYQAVETTLLKLVRQIVVVAIALLFCLVCNYCKKNYEKTRKEIYVSIAILAAMVNTAVIVGDRRSTQLIVMLLSVIILRGLFPHSKRRITLFIISTGVIVILFVTLYRWGSSSANDLNVLNTKAGSIEQITTMLQQSYGGPDSIANGIKFGRENGITVLNFFYDMGRSIFGLSFIFSRFGIATSNLYNLYIYSGRFETGQLLFSTSYGYITLGILYPLITLSNIFIAFIIERWFRKTHSLEVKYMSGYCLMRIMLGSVQSLPSIITVATMQIGTMGLVILISYGVAASNSISNKKLT